MAANLNPIFCLTPNIGRVVFSTANVNRDGTGTVPTLFTAGANGSLLPGLVVQALASTSAGQIRVFLHDGAAFFLYEEIAVSAITPSASVQAWTGPSQRITPVTPLALPTGWTVRISTHVGESFAALAPGGDY